MEMKRVANDKSKYTKRSKVGLKIELEEEVHVTTRQQFVATAEGYFLWLCATKDDIKM